MGRGRKGGVSVACPVAVGLLYHADFVPFALICFALVRTDRNRACFVSVWQVVHLKTSVLSFVPVVLFSSERRKGLEQCVCVCVCVCWAHCALAVDWLVAV